MGTSPQRLAGNLRESVVLPRAKRNSYYQVKFRPPDTAISFG
jgi:hypothetical protein